MHGRASRPTGVKPFMHRHQREHRVGQPIAGIEFDSFLVELLGLSIAFGIAPWQGMAAQHALIGGEAGWWTAFCLFRANRLHAPDERTNDGSYQFVLNREDFLRLSVVAFGPDVAAADRVNQLRGDAEPVAEFDARCPRPHSGRRVRARCASGRGRHPETEM